MSRSPSPSRSPRADGVRVISGRQRRSRHKSPCPVVEEDRKRIGTEIRNNQIVIAIAVDIARRNAPRTGSSGYGRRRSKSAGAAVEQDRDIVVAVVGDGDIDVLVAVEIGQCDGDRTGSRCDRRTHGLRERPVAVVEHHGNGIRLVVGGYEINVTVAVKVADRETARNGPHGHRTGRERGVAVVERHSDVIAAVVGGQEVDVTVAVEVGRFDLARAVGDRNRRAGDEGAGTVVKQDRDVVADVVGEQEIEVAVAVQISSGVGDRVSARGKRRTGGVAEHRGYFPSKSAPVRRSLPPPAAHKAHCRDASNTIQIRISYSGRLWGFRLSLDSRFSLTSCVRFGECWNRDTVPPPICGQGVIA